MLHDVVSSFKQPEASDGRDTTRHDTNGVGRWQLGSTSSQDLDQGPMQVLVLGGLGRLAM